MRKPVQRIALFSGLILTATLITLAFIPHYGCACGGETVNGSQLTFLPQTIAEFLIAIVGFVVEVIRAILP